MVDNELLMTGLVVILAGIGLILLGGAAYIAHEARERRLDERAGIRTGEGAPADAAAGACEQADGGGKSRHRPQAHQPA
ncbi:hypothetical protein [Streptomonospora wellingtoniae]|uniref:Uncharacterized protein n=1 Tax=Streptomonospora wellingtoniae TaxID=3075544 RepID=A0ABU2KU23_9ACTN|nr:hypothetical protein [Streptomonospora sp. DSM 45055]MDT0302573.1 hypothetical protein [Streptomonospora sp. DSM 45055]